MPARVIECPHENHVYLMVAEDDVCRGCGKIVEPPCGSACVCCEDGDCRCWKQAREQHSVCIVHALYDDSQCAFVCSVGHVIKAAPDVVMVLSGAERLC